MVLSDAYFEIIGNLCQIDLACSLNCKSSSIAQTMCYIQTIWNSEPMLFLKRRIPSSCQNKKEGSCDR